MSHANYFGEKNVIGYVRVSTEEQNRHGFGMDVQRSAIENYCAAMGWNLVDIIEEPAESGSSIKKRSKFMSLLERVKDESTRDFDGVVAVKLDRFARNLKELLIIHDDIFEPANCSLISIKDQFDTSTAQGRLFFQIIGGFAEFERSVITERMIDGIDNKAKAGQHATGRIPTGYRKTIVNGKKAIEIDEDERLIVELIFRLRDEQRMSYQQIADFLNEKGYKPKRWSPEKPIKFHNSSVQVIYKNQRYHGIYTLNRYKKVRNRDGETEKVLVDQIVTNNDSLRIFDLAK